MGESGVGKSSVSEILCKWYGLTQIQSYTTRPRRYPDEEGHIYLDKSQFKSIDEIKRKYPNRVAETVFDGEFYFATAEQVDECDLYVIDPAGVAYLKENYVGKKGIRVIRIKCSTQDRIERMQERGDSDTAIYQRLINDKAMFAHVGEISDFSVVNIKRDLCAMAIAKYIKKQEAKSVSRLTILVDWDDVINDLMPKALELLNASRGTDYTLESFPEFDFSKYLPEADSNALHALFLSKELWDVLRPAKDAQKALKRMIDDGHEVLIVTSTHYLNVAWKMEWLAKYFPFIQWDQVIVANRKDKIRGDWLIDDNPRHIKNHPYGRVCMDKPWNRWLNDDVYDIIRVKNLKDAYEAILVRENEQEIL